MKFTATTGTHKLMKLSKRIRLIPGGTSAGKTISILLILINAAQSDESPKLTSIVSESFPHLKRGAMRDFINILQSHGYYKDEAWNRSDYTYTFETGSKIEFFSADQPGKVRGPRRDRLFVNEANNIPQESWVQLLLRTRDYAFADWNPTNDFYMYEDYVQDEDAMTTKTDDAEFLILTYKDNEALEQAIIREIESRKANKNWFKVYGEGKRGALEGKIYRDWNLSVTTIPHTARLERRGLDFGYSQDPVAVVDVYYHDGGYILDEQLYQKGMSNQAISEFIKNLEQPQTLIIADSAEPKSIDEMRMYGINVLPATKGPGSLNQRIQLVQGKRISVTTRSVNLIKEYRNYLWKTDKEGRILDVPEGGLDHALDAMGYAIASLNVRTNVQPFKPKVMLQMKYGRA